MASKMMAAIAAAACAAAVSMAAPREANAFAGSSAADGIAQASPVAVAQARYRRGYYYRPRVVCSVRYRQFYNGLFWQTAPVRVCWRR